MNDIPIASTVVRLFIAATFLLQLGLLVVAPIPSPVATRRMVRWRRSAEGCASQGQSTKTDPLLSLLLPLAALLGVMAVVAAAAHPPSVSGFMPQGTSIPCWLGAAGGICLLTGNLLVAAAALTLKCHTRFDACGQSAVLLSGGVFGLSRHPIVCGLGLIYLGLFLALPSPLVLAGLLGYLFHQQRRLAAEEALLEKRFGHAYRDYRRRVGLFGPKWLLRG